MTRLARPLDPPRPLVPGEPLDQPTFHALYEAMPPGTRAELIDGVVQMPSPAGEFHATAIPIASGWLTWYALRTPGVQVLADPTTVLGTRSEVQPDLALRILPDKGGQTRPHGRFIAGGYELVVEISHTSRAKDLGIKRLEYERAGVLEYVVRTIEPAAIHWFARSDAGLVRRVPDADGLYRSSAFPGLWADPADLIANDFQRLVDAVNRGCATADHAAFVDRLARA